MTALGMGLLSEEAIILPVIFFVPAVSCAWLFSASSRQQQTLHGSTSFFAIVSNLISRQFVSVKK
jgi:hypothetical protein